MIFKTISSDSELYNTDQLTVYLMRDHWNDLWKYENLYSIYVSQNGKIEYIGATKIANIDNQYKFDSKSVVTELPKEFFTLTENYVSIGQDVGFYKSLNSFSDDMRESILDKLNDLAFKIEIFEKLKNEHVVKNSLLRNVSSSSVRGQFKRLANGRAVLTPYNFKYTIPKPNLDETEEELYEDAVLAVDVIPNSSPPTNLHVLIGRNGVGKTHLLKSFVSSLLDNDISREDFGILDYHVDEFDIKDTLFANIITVSFSGFDNENFHFLDNINSEIPYYEVSLMEEIDDERSPKTVSQMANEFTTSLEILSKSGRSARWKEAVRVLNSDPIFAKLDIESLIAEINYEKIPLLFKKLSSGHMYVLSIITQLVEKIEERSIVIMDEPETHLHPPLIASLMRVLTELLIYRNAVGLVATHSPVVVQEVPSTCVTKINRVGKYTDLIRPKLQTFGENVGTLTREIFGLEIVSSGFHRRLNEAVEKHDSYEEIVKYFNNQLGAEARTIIRSLLLSR